MSKNASKYVFCFSRIFLFICIISLLLFFCTFSPSSKIYQSKNELKEKEFRYLKSYLNDTYKSGNSTTTSKEDILTILNFTYPIFILLSLYMICQIRRNFIDQEEINRQVYKFIYLSNIGYFIIGYSDIKLNDNDISYYIFYVSIAITGIGTIIIIVTFFKNICNLLEVYFTFKAIGIYFIIPCAYVWRFLGLTDPCCTQTTYTVTTYADGHKESDYMCVCMCNGLVWIIKRFAMLMTTIIYYLVAFIILLPLWIALKILVTIILLISCYYCRNKDNHDDLLSNSSSSTPLYEGMN